MTTAIQAPFSTSPEIERIDAHLSYRATVQIFLPCSPTAIEVSEQAETQEEALLALGYKLSGIAKGARLCGEGQWTRGLEVGALAAGVEVDEKRARLAESKAKRAAMRAKFARRRAEARGAATAAE